MDGKQGKDVERKFVEVGKTYNECRDGKAKLIGATSAP